MNKPKNLSFFFVLLNLLLLLTISASISAADLSLEEAVKQALERNSRVYQSDKDLELARLNYIKALGIALPKVSLKYDYSHLRYRYEQENTISSGPLEFTTTLPQDYDSNQASINVVQPLLSGGRDWFLFFGAFDIERLTKATGQRTRQEVVYDVKEAFYKVLSLTKMVGVMEQAKEQMTEHLNVARALFEQGMVVKTDVLRAEMSLATAEQNLIKTRNGLKLARAGLNFLIDEDVDANFTLADETDEAEDLVASYEECVELALRFRPEIQQVKSKVAIDKKYVWIARADYLPSLNLFYNHKLEGGLMVKDDPEHWDDTSDKESWVAGGTFELKLFNGGMTSAAVREAKINLNKTQKQAADLRKNIKLNVLAAYSRSEESQARLKTSSKSALLASENFRIVNLRYKEGMAQSIHVMEAHTALLNAKTGALSAFFDHKLALAELEKAVGLELKEGDFVNVKQNE